MFRFNGPRRARGFLERWFLLRAASIGIELEIGAVGAGQMCHGTRGSPRGAHGFASLLNRVFVFWEDFLSCLSFTGAQHLRQKIELLFLRRVQELRFVLRTDQIGDDFERVTLLNEKLLSLRAVIHLRGVGGNQRVEESVVFVGVRLLSTQLRRLWSQNATQALRLLTSTPGVR